MDKNSVFHITCDTIRKNKGLSLAVLLTVSGSVMCALVPPLILEQMINDLTSRQNLLLSAAFAYFLAAALSGLADAAKESLITIFGQKVTHRIRSVMNDKLLRLPAAYFIKNEPGVTASRFMNDVNTVDSLFTSGVISMAADVCKLVSIFIVIFTKSKGLGLLLLMITPVLFGMTRLFQKRMLKAQIENRIAVGKTNQQIPETLKNIRTIRILHRENYMQKRYGKTIDQSFIAQERSNFYDAIYSPIIISVSALLIGVMMTAAGQSGITREFFGMSAGTAAAVIAYVGNFFNPLESIGMEIQNVQSAVAGVRRINEFLKEQEENLLEESVADPYIQNNNGSPAVSLSGICFRYDKNEPEVFHDLNMTVSEGETVIISGRTGAGKSTLMKLILGLYQPGHGQVRIFETSPHLIPNEEKRRLFGYVEQEFHRIPGTVGAQISLNDPQVTDEQIQKALDTVGMWEVIQSLPRGIHETCTEHMFSQGQFQLLSIARAIVLNPKLLLLDEITANLDSKTENQVLMALNKACENRTVISVSHRLFEKQKNEARIISL